MRSYIDIKESNWLVDGLHSVEIIIRTYLYYKNVWTFSEKHVIINQVSRITNKITSFD